MVRSFALVAATLFWGNVLAQGDMNACAVRPHVRLSRFPSLALLPAFDWSVIAAANTFATERLRGQHLCRSLPHGMQGRR